MPRTYHERTLSIVTNYVTITGLVLGVAGYTTYQIYLTTRPTEIRLEDKQMQQIVSLIMEDVDSRMAGKQFRDESQAKSQLDGIVASLVDARLRQYGIDPNATAMPVNATTTSNLVGLD